MTPAIGKLRHRLTLEAPSRAGDGGGGADISWTAVAACWGAIEDVTGSEAQTADRTGGRRQVIVSIRHRDDVAPAMRFRLDGRILPIRAVIDPEGRRKYLRCLCEERDL
jgi:SPP1 family predicted phage head-tail adaptor